MRGGSMERRSPGRTAPAGAPLRVRPLHQVRLRRARYGGLDARVHHPWRGPGPHALTHRRARRGAFPRERSARPPTPVTTPPWSTRSRPVPSPWLGNAPWRFAERPSAHDLGEYRHRMRPLALDSRGLDWSDVALRFAAPVPGVSTCIVGTGRLEHLRRNIRTLEKDLCPRTSWRPSATRSAGVVRVGMG